VWDAALLARASARGRALTLEVVLRKQHYIQACVQGSILRYWGWYWREVYHSAPLLVAQLLFAYAFDMLLVWWRRDTYTLGFGPFPVVFSINLFLWFKPDWFYLQFVLIALGFTAKELIRWNKDGRQAHIFNPSSFPLGVFALVLLLTGSTALTWGAEIATTQFPSAAHVSVHFPLRPDGAISLRCRDDDGVGGGDVLRVRLAYFWSTGVYYFSIPIFRLRCSSGCTSFTDPATAPQTETRADHLRDSVRNGRDRHVRHSRQSARADLL
jgi:hypothetical protein